MRRWIGKKKGYNGPMGHLFRFSTSFPRIVAIGNFLGPWYDEEESVDRTRIGASAVTWENRKRELSPLVVLHVLLPLFLPPIRLLGASTFSPNPYLLLFSRPQFLSHWVCPPSTPKISTKRKEKREKERREYYSSKLSLYISVRLTLNHNERRWLKTRSRVIGAFTWF